MKKQPFHDFLEWDRFMNHLKSLGARPWNEVFWPPLPNPTPKPQLVKKKDSPWFWNLEVSSRTFHCILNTFRDHHSFHNAEDHPGETHNGESFPDQAVVLDMHPRMIKNFGIVSFADLVAAMIAAGTDPLNLARSRFWQMAPEEWREHARQSAERIKPGSAEELV